jgi:hypothetical protein
MTRWIVALSLSAGSLALVGCDKEKQNPNRSLYSL